MVKALIAFRRREGMDVEAFQTHWRGAHAKVVVGLPGIVRYVQSHPKLAGYRKGDLPFDGVAELWFENVEVLRAHNDSAAYRAILEDEARFLDLNSKRLILCDDHVVRDEPVGAGAVKNIEFLVRSRTMAVADFQEYWRDTHAPKVCRLEQLGRYVQSHVRLGGYANGRQPAFDGVALTWFENTDAMRASASSPAYSLVREDENNFLAPGPAPALITHEYVVVDSRA